MSAWYKTGTVNVIQGSQTVAGVDTNFIANARVGDGFRGPDGGWYEVLNIASSTAMAIYPAYEGASADGATYMLAPLQGYTKESADRLRQVVDKYGDILEVIGDANLIARVAMVQADATGNIPAADLAQALGLQLLQPKESGKGLSQENFTTLLKDLLEALPGRVTAVEQGKVDKVAGKGLSTNDFTTAEQQKLAGLESSHFKGEFSSLAGLQAAIPIGVAGDYARVDAGAGADVDTALWDTSDNKWVTRASEGGPMTPTEIKEGYESNPNTNAFTDSEKTKLAGVAAGATQNASDAALRARSSHTGTQLAATISDFAGTVRATVLTGLVAGTNVAIAAADSILTALAKLQTQLDNKLGLTAKAADSDKLNGQAASFYTAEMVPASPTAAGSKGLVPAPALGATRFLSSLGTWLVVNASATWGSITGTITDQVDLKAALDAKLTATLVDYVIIYPNGGTAAVPATAALGATYTTANPFPGFNVITQAEFLYSGEWYTATPLGVAGTAAGAASGQVGSNIILRIAISNIIYNLSGWLNSTAPASTSSLALPCRIKVWKVKA